MGVGLINRLIDRPLEQLDHARIPKYRDFFAWDGATARPVSGTGAGSGWDGASSLVL